MSEANEKKVITNPVKAIRAFCLECVGSSHEVKNCSSEDCALHPFRQGRNPYRTKREMSEEQKAAAAERLRKARESRLSEKAQ